jgi:hypothetical protein
VKREGLALVKGERKYFFLLLNFSVFVFVLTNDKTNRAPYVFMYHALKASLPSGCGDGNIKTKEGKL